MIQHFDEHDVKPALNSRPQAWLCEGISPAEAARYADHTCDVCRPGVLYTYTG